MTEGRLRIVRPGLLTTVQDAGRWGHQALGVPVAGPMDPFSHRLANLLVGNPHGAATLEITLIGPELECDAQTTMVVTGADFDVLVDGVVVPSATTFSVEPGTRVRFGRRAAGARAYLAVAGGGILTAPVLGSRATHLVSGMGGLDGRALVAGDELPIAAAPTPVRPRRAIGLALPAKGRAVLRLLPGPQIDWFTPDALSVLTTTPFQISTRSNRMGYRLEGAPLLRRREDEPISEALAFGSLQVPAAGTPILLMADRQTAGGYPKVGTVISADLPVAGQLAPGDAVEFAFVDRAAAAAALIARERQLLRYAEPASS
ncbi:MAG: biotin-dependent carboxyltransferase family protein [Acidobacteriota bacterium]